MYGVEIPARNNLGIPYLCLKRVMIGMEDSRRAPTIPNTGSIFKSGKITGNLKCLSVTVKWKYVLCAYSYLVTYLEWLEQEEPVLVPSRMGRTV